MGRRGAPWWLLRQVSSVLTPMLSLLSAHRAWMEEGLNSLKDYWSTLTNFWPLAAGAAPGTTAAPSV